MTLDEALEDLALLEDDLERYEYVMDLGRHLPPFPEEARSEAHRVRGCTSQVWMRGRFTGGPPARLSLEADADARIVRGLVALLYLATEGRTAEEILATDATALLSRLHFADQLTPGRQNGLYAMIERIRALASEAQTPPGPEGD